jgi:F0F1-type ATP synthase epsilon subunit
MAKHTKEPLPDHLITAKVLSPTQTFYSGPAVSVSAVNKVGPFDVLVDHANFFSLLTTCNVVINTGTQQLTFPITHGIIKVHANTVTLFIYQAGD